MPKLPLDGVRVTDFCWIGAGSYTTKMLADFGADVVKIESSTRPDSLRVSGPFKDKVRGINRSGYFADRNTSKRSMCINMKHPEGQRIARELIARSNIVANNFTPGTMEKFGLGYPDVRKIKPDIIYISMSMQGSDGPEHSYLGYGLTIGALTGLQHLTGLPEREPAGTGTNYPDHIPNPCHAAFAILAALRHRRRTGQGQYIEVAQTEPMIALLAPAVVDFTANGRVQTRQGNQHPGAAPYGVYPCAGADRWIAIAVMTDEQWLALVDVLGAPAWAADPRWPLATSRYEDRHELDDCLAKETASWRAEALMHALQARGVPAGVVQTAADVVDHDPQLSHRGHWVRLNHPEMGRTIYNKPPFRFSRIPSQLRSPAPLLGQHTEEVCMELLGMDPQEVASLVEEGALV